MAARKYRKFHFLTPCVFFCASVIWVIVILVCAWTSGIFTLSALDKVSEDLGLFQTQMVELERGNSECMRPAVAVSKGEVEDLFCLRKPDYDPAFKNPCWWVENTNAANPLAIMLNFFSKPADSYSACNRTLRCLPYAHILCCSKAGTTDLFQRLSLHPDIVKTGNEGKEHLYWSWFKYGFHYKGRWGKPKLFSKYVESFSQLGCILETKNESLSQKIALDGSPPDMWDLRGWPLLPQNRDLAEPKVVTPHLMKHLYRDPKFIVLMRDPVERLYTAYIFHGMGKNAETFHYDVIHSIRAFNACLATMPSRRQCYLNSALTEALSVELPFMCYAFYIKEWLAVFPRKHFLFMQSERYGKDTRTELLKVFDFLNMSRPDPQLLGEMLKTGKRYHTKQKDRVGAVTMWNTTRSLLRSFVASCNKELAELLHDDAYLWKNDNETLPGFDFYQMVQDLDSYRRGTVVRDYRSEVRAAMNQARRKTVREKAKKADRERDLKEKWAKYREEFDKKT